VREDGRTVESLAELDRDRGRSADPTLGERIRFLADDLAQRVGLEMDLVAAGSEEPSHCTCDGPDTRSGGREAAAGGAKHREEILATTGVLVGLLDERLDRAAGHPAGAVASILTEFSDPGFEGGGHRTPNCSVAVVEPEISVVVTLFNERDTVGELVRRTAATLDGESFELLLVDDGSTDGTWDEVVRAHTSDQRVRGVRLKRNFGQHPAMHAGLVRARGEVFVTMDGDLQNSPEDIPKLVAAVRNGSDVASGRRAARRDSWGRTLPSRMVNGMLRRFTGASIADFGCAFNAYRRSAVEPVLGAIGRQKFTKALVLSGGANVVEVDVAHEARRGESRYTPLRLTRLALHVLAGFWPQPIQWIGVALGALCTLAALALGIYGVAYWIAESDFPGPLFGGTLIVFVLGVQGFILALIGEYLARIQRDVEGRPLYTIDREL
jgi:undecaprenyl-phosphate 4-deoxy-4-formamido-L-arabinose transferase